MANSQISRKPTRNLALELARVTEAAALAAGRQMGRGDKVAADKAAVDAMRLVLNTIEINGVIVIGEVKRTTPRCCSTASTWEPEAIRPRWISLWTPWMGPVRWLTDT
jgi:hypothetical protein